MRAVSILTVQSTDVWDELAAATDLEGHVEERPDALSAVVRPSFFADAPSGGECPSSVGSSSSISASFAWIRCSSARIFRKS